jgi:hypothetical protein
MGGDDDEGIIFEKIENSAVYHGIFIVLIGYLVTF